MDGTRYHTLHHVEWVSHCISYLKEKCCNTQHKGFMWTCIPAYFPLHFYSHHWCSGEANISREDSSKRFIWSRMSLKFVWLIYFFQRYYQWRNHLLLATGTVKCGVCSICTGGRLSDDGWQSHQHHLVSHHDLYISVSGDTRGRGSDGSGEAPGWGGW